MAIAETESAKHSDRLKAAELLGKITGVNLFNDQNHEASILKLNSALDLESRIRSLAALSRPAINVQPIDIIKEPDLDFP